jgi:peroxiredoxin
MKPSVGVQSQIHLPQMLSVGDIAPHCVLPDPSGNRVDLYSDSIAGNPIVIIFCPRQSDTTAEMLQNIVHRIEAFTAQGARVFAVSPSPITIPNLPFPVLLDHDRRVFAGFTVPRDQFSIVVLRRNYHVAGILSGEVEAQVATAMSLLEKMAWERETVTVRMHPPALLIPEALSRGDCMRLISVFETTGQAFVERPPPIGDFLNGADFKMRVPEHGRKDRIDHFFFEKGMLAFLNNRINRIVPEIAKAFQYQVTRYETLRVACYEGHRGGYLHGHRDNIPPTTYRRFAMSINLNIEDFEGGELRFPEFGDQRYRPDSGTAIVFSSSLLHEAMHVTAGRRYVLLAFLF